MLDNLLIETLTKQLNFTRLDYIQPPFEAAATELVIALSPAWQCVGMLDNIGCSKGLAHTEPLRAEPCNGQMLQIISKRYANSPPPFTTR